ncbi:MAG: hypothetical protein IT337_00195 [Thermomicrobiales bacterium]|nr:hypothetical protein [Thermomicrobiales bacterium]
MARRITATAAAAAIGVLGAAGALGLAQDVTPQDRPVQLYEGRCADLGARLDDLELNDATVPEGDRIGSESGVSAETAFSRLPQTLDALTDSPHVIVVARSVDEPDVWLVCGDIGGALDENGALAIGLTQVDASGYAGIAFLAEDAERDRTNLSVFIAPTGGRPAEAALPPEISDTFATPGTGGALSAGATPVIVPTREPTPTPTPRPVGGAIDVTLSEWQIRMPDRLKAGPAVFTITNDGERPHNFVMANELYVFSLDADLAPGESASLSVNLPPGQYVVSSQAGDGADAEHAMALTVTAEE